MNRFSRFKKPEMQRPDRFISPERLAKPELMFEAVCGELAISGEARIESDLLADRIIAAGDAVESEMMLVTAAKEAVADHRERAFCQCGPPRPNQTHRILAILRRLQRAPLSEQRTILIEICGVEFHQLNKPLEIVKNDLPAAERQKPFFAQLPQDAVDMYGT